MKGKGRDVPASRVDGLLQKMLPWLRGQFSDDLQWLGNPERPDYESACPAARHVKKPLDGEVASGHMSLAIEHTGVPSFPEQLRMGGVFTGLRELVREFKSSVPAGNVVTILVKPELLGSLTRRQVERLLPDVRTRLEAYCKSFPKYVHAPGDIGLPPRFGPGEWTFDALSVFVSRQCCRCAGTARFGNLVGGYPLLEGMRECVAKAIGDKVEGKAESFRAYREGGWMTAVFIEVADFSLPAFEAAGNVFNDVAGDFDLSHVDCVALVDSTDEAQLLCCWAYKDGSLRTEEQQRAEIIACLD